MKKEFTATVYIIYENKFLLQFHPKLQKWLPSGGHMEPNETPPEAARREVLEETGLEIEFITQENIWINEPNCNSFERPYLCLLEEVPQYKEVPPHYHIDLIYIAEPVIKSFDILVSSPPTRWFGLDDLEKLKPNIEIYNETLNTIKHILQNYAHTNSLTS